MSNSERKDLIRLFIVEARAARLGLGHWANLPVAVRRGNARTHLLMAATVRGAL